MRGQPHFHIVGFGRAEAHVARAERDNAVGQLEQLKQLAGVAAHDFKLVKAVVGVGKAHHFHLGELVHADKPARVLARAARLGAEAGRGRAVGAGQVGLVQHFARVQVGKRHFGGGDKVVFPFAQLEQIFLKLGQLARAGHAGAVDHVGRANFNIVLFHGVLVEKKVYQGAFKTCAPLERNHKTAAGKAGGAFKVKAAQGNPQVAVFARLKVKFTRCAPTAHFHVFRFVLAHGHTGIGQVGHAHEPGFHIALGLGGFHVQFLDAVGNAAHFSQQGRGVLARALFGGHFGRGRVAAALEGFHLCKQGAAAGVQRQKFVHVQIRMPVGQSRGQHFGLFLHQFEVNHSRS